MFIIPKHTSRCIVQCTSPELVDINSRYVFEIRIAFQAFDTHCFTFPGSRPTSSLHVSPTHLFKNRERILYIFFFEIPILFMTVVILNF